MAACAQRRVGPDRAALRALRGTRAVLAVLSVPLALSTSVRQHLRQLPGRRSTHSTGRALRFERPATALSGSQVLLDPYYRTLRGIVDLIEKEWVSFGHKFQDRCGRTQSTQSTPGPSVLWHLRSTPWTLGPCVPVGLELQSLGPSASTA